MKSYQNSHRREKNDRLGQELSRAEEQLEEARKLAEETLAKANLDHDNQVQLVEQVLLYT